MTIRIGTRGSTLALIQAQIVEKALQSKFPGTESSIVKVKTTGDIIKDRPLYDIGGKGLFIKEIEEMLIRGAIDVAVHSVKDVPGYYSEDLEIPCILPRSSAADVFVSFEYSNIASLPTGSRVGTSSVRRRVQLLAMRPDLEVVPIRGNVDTRLSKVHRREYAGIILAEAGLDRISKREVISEILPTDVMLGAVGQGAICIQCRKSDDAMIKILQELSHKRSFMEVLAERSFLRAVNGSCDTPLAAKAQYLSDDLMNMKCMLAENNGRMVFSERTFHECDAEKVGTEMGEELKGRLSS